MHLAANSIGHWLSDLEGDQIYKGTYFYDEIFSHYIWHFAVAALSAQLIYRSWKYPIPNLSYQIVVLIIAGSIYGLTIFIMGIEGGTVLLLLPFSVLVAIILIILKWRKKKAPPHIDLFYDWLYASGLNFYWLGTLLGFIPSVFPPRLDMIRTRLNY